jgi:hypothetical protein
MFRPVPVEEAPVDELPAKGANAAVSAWKVV